jgi:hypothetical protein
MKIETLNLLVDCINGFNMTELCKSLDKYNFVKEFYRGSVIPEELHVEVINLCWQPAWANMIINFTPEINVCKYQILYKWLYYHSAWETLSYLRKDTIIPAKYLYDREESPEANKAKMLKLYSLFEFDECINILLICLPATTAFCEELFLINNINIYYDIIQTIKKLINSFRSYKKPIWHRLTYYPTGITFITKMNLFVIYEACITHVIGIKFINSARYMWISACLLIKE